jgi:exodeoxyribonuclease V alpha subunit
MEQIFGYIERITFQNAENGFTVAQLMQKGKSQSTCVVGFLPGVQPGEFIRCKGTWKNHLVHGRQFEVTEFQVEKPADVVGIQKYLGSGLIKGIGSAYASRLVEKFGAETLNIIEFSPERLSEVRGFGKKRIDTIIHCWNDQRSIRDVMVFLQSVGVSPGFAQKIFKNYGTHSIAKLKENPYTLAKDIHGIGFKTADGLAQKLGMAKDAPQRIDSGIEYVLSELSTEGHVCYPVADFIRSAHEMLEVDAIQIEDRLDQLREADRIEILPLISQTLSIPFIWLKPFYLSESGISGEIRRLQYNPCNLRGVDLTKAIDWVQNQLHIQLAENQKQAVISSMTEKLHIITGGPGTGKSTITKAILALTEKLTKKIFLAAPTGRAAKRMTEITGQKAFTIHSLLEFDFQKGGFKRNRKSPLDCDLIIVDEASMIDTMLMYSLLKAIPDGARVIFVGDINQLPSVGPGNVLKDMIASGCMLVTQLTEIFRQAAGSRIITNAHRINLGQYPDISNHSGSDFYYIEAQKPEDVLKDILGLVSFRLPKKYDFNPLKDIQVLAPMKKGVIGTQNLNLALQETLNNKEQYVFRGGQKFMVGDKVMQLKNDYKREVFNGDIGYITEIDTVEQRIVVQIDDRDVIYEFSDLDELTLAYAVSIHKYQGSECPCVIMPIHTSHFKLLHRNLLYTGVTRGKKLVILVGMKKALALAVRNDEVKKRYTGLKSMLMDINLYKTPGLR